MAPSPLALSVRSPGRPLPAWIPAWGRASHLRLGSSVCAQRMPDSTELERAAAGARERGLGLELVTPPCSDAELARLVRRLDVLGSWAPDCAVVVNDWGVLDAISEKYHGFQVIIGRLLNRQMKDPRLAQEHGGGSGHDRSSPGLGSAVSPAWRAVVRAAGAVRVELDWPTHGLDVDAWGEIDLDLSLHLPWTLVAAGRTCVLRDPRGALDRLAGGSEPCARSCDGVVVELEPARPGVGAHVRAGPADLVRLDDDATARALAWVATDAGPDRVIVDPDGAPP